MGFSNPTSKTGNCPSEANHHLTRTRCLCPKGETSGLERVGLNADRVISRRKKRDPKFRDYVLTAYEYRCAVCGFDLRLGNVTVGLEGHQLGPI